MKNLIVLLPILFLISCNEDEPQQIDPFVGQWAYTSLNAAANLDMVFEVVKRNEGYELHNFQLHYDLFENETFPYATIGTWHKFIDKEKGFGGIQIEALNENRSKWLVFKFKYNTFYKKDESIYSMRVDELEIVDMANNGTRLVLLRDQFFYKQI